MSEMTYRDALNLALKEEMRHDPSVFVLGEDVALYEGSFKVTRGLLAEFGEERVKDTPISENTIIGVSVGAAMGGLRPVAELMTVNFALLAMDQIVNHMSKIRSMFGGQTHLPMTIRMPGGGGSQLAAQHSQSLETMFMHCPGMHVLYPATPADASRCVRPNSARLRNSSASSTTLPPSPTEKRGKIGWRVCGRNAQRSAISTVLESASGRSANSSRISVRVLKRCSCVNWRRSASATKRPSAIQISASCAS